MCLLEEINDLQKKIFENQLDIYQVLDFLEDEGLMNEIHKKIRNMEFYSLNGLLQMTLDELMCIRGRVTLLFYKSEQEFINLIEYEFKKFYTPMIITLPINVIINNNSFTNISFKNSNINIFSKDEQGLILLNKYFNKNIYADFNSRYILRKNDNNFINYPLMTIFIKGIEYSVNIEAPKIVEAIYSIIRMTAMHKVKHYDDIRELPPMGSTYAVNYNVIKSPNQQISNSSYGYSYRIGFANILDMSIKEIEIIKDEISNLITKLIDYTFYNKNSKINKENEKCRKWINALLLFNEAYELASIEKYDTANLILLTILESFFIAKNTKVKKDTLKKRVPPLVSKRFDETLTCNVIENTYKKRNYFIHEGQKIENRIAYRTLGDYQGLRKGLEPINYSNESDLKNYTDLYYISLLFEIVSFCITSQYDLIASEYILK